ncbi:hypothetical protein [Pasteurella sp. PK-2025]|uniref:hypothetical protein n=1 Tax=Pasteurella sp. PK-2025 TaxID=3413133 RepID=UPI003C76D9B2
MRINKANHLAFKYLKQTQKAIVHCNALGLTVKQIDFSGIKPRIFVDDNPPITKKLINANKANKFAFGSDKNVGRWEQYYTMLEGIKVIWRAAPPVQIH